MLLAGVAGLALIAVVAIAAKTEHHDELVRIVRHV
jgi:hypothetical protein